ncbi:Uncharacterised protein [Blautia obeum]|uniref:Uncharacterized protein n=1 Tax=Blautia obeum TaxID=40520 RepID=A0A174HJ51_9FIRM|nr:Uncharacterised protein [Blautia obeum]
MPVVQFQICFIFSFCSFVVHHIPVKDRHGMVPAGKFRPSGQHSGLFPLPQPGLIRRYTSKRMLDRGPAEVRRHLRKTKVKIKPGCVFLRHVYHMLCGIKTLFCLRDLPQFFPDLCVDLCQVTDCLTIDLHCLTDRDILFSYLHTIAGYCPHILPPFPQKTNVSGMIPVFRAFSFLFPSGLRYRQIPAHGSVH